MFTGVKTGGETGSAVGALAPMKFKSWGHSSHHHPQLRQWHSHPFIPHTQIDTDTFSRPKFKVNRCCLFRIAKIWSQNKQVRRDNKNSEQILERGLTLVQRRDK